MKRIIKPATTSCDFAQLQNISDTKEAENETSRDSKDAPKNSRSTRNKHLIETTQADSKVDLSKFKMAKKEKIKAQNASSRPAKRQHLTVVCDEGSTSNSCSENEGSYEDNKAKDDAQVAKKTPKNWQVVLQNLREMRKDFNAPVDTMGCDQCSDEQATPEDKRFQSLLSLMLSSQTKDQVTHAAMMRLREHGCSLQNILNTSNEKLGELIYPVSFWKTKAKNIKRTAEMIKDTFDSDIPKTAEDLCKLPGVGPKMAHLCMKTAWGQVTGIGVDTHVHRITNRLGWVKTKTPEDTRKALEDWLPYSLWSEVNHLLVGFGQQTCQPVRPQCEICLNNQLCPFGIKEMGSKNRKKKN